MKCDISRTMEISIPNFPVLVCQTRSQMTRLHENYTIPCPLFAFCIHHGERSGKYHVSKAASVNHFFSPPTLFTDFFLIFFSTVDFMWFSSFPSKRMGIFFPKKKQKRPSATWVYGEFLFR